MTPETFQRLFEMTDLGIPVWLLPAGQKGSNETGWENKATTNEKAILQRIQEKPDWTNYALVAKAEAGGFLFLDDDGGIRAEYEKIYGPMDETRKHQSCGGSYHYLYRHSAVSLEFQKKIGRAYISETNGNGELWSLRMHNSYIVGPGSIATSKNGVTAEYRVAWPAPIIEIPNALLNFLANRYGAAEEKLAKSETWMDDPIPEGARNKTLFAIGCALRNAGLDEEGILAALTVKNQNQCSAPLSNSELQIIAHSAAGYEPAKTTLLVGGKPVDGVDAFKPAQQTEESANSEEVQAQEEVLPLFPRFPGLLTELCDAICPDIPYEFKFMAAVTHWGLIRSGLDSLEGEPTLQPRFFTCFVKEPDYGKTAAINEIRNAMKMIGQRYSDVTSVDSGPALVDEFSDVQGRMLLASGQVEVSPPARVLLDPDEMSDLFEKSKTTAQGRNSLSKELLKLYESTRTGNRSRKAGRSQIENAHLAILGSATPDGYRIMWTGTSGGSGGLQSRFVLITTQNGKMPVKKQPTNATALARVLEQLIPLSVSDPHTVRLSNDSQTMLVDWWKSAARDKSSEDRISDMVKRLLIVLGPTNGVAIIGPALMSQAIQWGNYLIACREEFNPADSYSWTQAFENDIRADLPPMNRSRMNVRFGHETGGQDEEAHRRAGHQ